MSRHVRTEVLAQFREGTLRPRRAARIEAHLARCDRCAAADAGLAGVSVLLAGAGPAPMPDQVIERLSAVLAAESARRAMSRGEQVSGPHMASEPAPAPGAEGVPVAVPVPVRDAARPEPASHRASRRTGRGFSSPLLLGGLAAAGALAVIVIVGVILTRAPSTGGPASAGSASGPANRNASTRRTETAGIDYSREGTPAVTTAVASDANLTAASLPGAISNRVSATGSSLGPKSAGSDSTANGAHSATPGAEPTTLGGINVAQLSGCVSRVSAGREVLLVEVARYQDARAVIIVMRSAPAGPDLEVVVAGAGCSASAADVITKTTVPAG